MSNKKGKRIFKKLKAKYRLVLINDSNFEELFTFRLSRLNVIAWVGLLAILFMVMITTLIVFTPLREYIPGYPDGNMRGNIIRNYTRVDSLENELRIKDQYIKNVRNILVGYNPTHIESNEDTAGIYKNINLEKGANDSLFQLQSELEEQYNLSIFNKNNSDEIVDKNHFYCPLNGLIINKFNMKESHYGIDIVASVKDPVKSTLDGTVILSAWTIETGNIVQIQHANGFISIYKHNSEIIKTSGDVVKAGDVIALFGNTGEITTGPHLHFELWHKGVPVNPEDYINF